MNSITQLIQNIKTANWSGANQMFADIMQQKVADRLAVERQTIFTEAASTNEKDEYRCRNCGYTAQFDKTPWECPKCHKEAIWLDENGIKEADTKYQEYFRSQLKKQGYDSPADIPADKKDDFFRAVDKGYTAKDE